MRVATIAQLQTLIKTGRLRLGLTQQELAGRIGMSRQWLSAFERGATGSVLVPTLLRLTEALNLAIDVRPVDESTDNDPAYPGAEGAVDLDDVLRRHRDGLERG